MILRRESIRVPQGPYVESQPAVAISGIFGRENNPRNLGLVKYPAIWEKAGQCAPV